MQAGTGAEVPIQLEAHPAEVTSRAMDGFVGSDCGGSRGNGGGVDGGGSDVGGAQFVAGGDRYRTSGEGSSMPAQDSTQSAQQLSPLAEGCSVVCSTGSVEWEGSIVKLPLSHAVGSPSNAPVDPSASSSAAAHSGRSASSAPSPLMTRLAGPPNGMVLNTGPRSTPPPPPAAAPTYHTIHAFPNAATTAPADASEGWAGDRFFTDLSAKRIAAEAQRVAAESLAANLRAALVQQQAELHEREAALVRARRQNSQLIDERDAAFALAVTVARGGDDSGRSSPAIPRPTSVASPCLSGTREGRCSPAFPRPPGVSPSPWLREAAPSCSSTATGRISPALHPSSSSVASSLTGSLMGRISRSSPPAAAPSASLRWSVRAESRGTPPAPAEPAERICRL